jgi:hypothetical protein
MIRWMGALAACALALGACREPSFDVDGLTVFGLDGAGNLVEFGTESADRVRRQELEGLEENESLLGIDGRGRGEDVELFGIASTGRPVRVTPLGGAVTPLGGPVVPLPEGPLGVDLEPGGGVLRVLTAGGRNLRIDLATGAAADEGALAYAPGDPGAVTTPRLVAAAYAPDGTLYAIDSNRDALVTLPSPATGQVRTIGPLGVNASDDAGLDVVDAGGKRLAFATLTVGTATEFRSVDLATGTAERVRRVAARSPVRSITVVPDERR